MVDILFRVYRLLSLATAQYQFQLEWAGCRCVKLLSPSELVCYKPRRPGKSISSSFKDFALGCWNLLILELEIEFLDCVCSSHS